MAKLQRMRGGGRAELCQEYNEFLSRHCEFWNGREKKFDFSIADFLACFFSHYMADCGLVLVPLFRGKYDVEHCFILETGSNLVSQGIWHTPYIDSRNAVILLEEVISERKKSI